MNWRERIAADPAVMVGKPVVKGTRVPVEAVVELVTNGWTEEQILRHYPRLTAVDIKACLEYALELVQSERMYPGPAGE